MIVNVKEPIGVDSYSELSYDVLNDLVETTL